MSVERLEVVLLAKGGCHLCDLVEAEIRSMRGVEAMLTVVDIDSDQALRDSYWIRVPVVTVGGKEVFEAKMMDPDGRWRERLTLLLKAGRHSASAADAPS